MVGNIIAIIGLYYSDYLQIQCKHGNNSSIKSIEFVSARGGCIIIGYHGELYMYIIMKSIYNHPYQ